MKNSLLIRMLECSLRNQDVILQALKLKTALNSFTFEQVKERQGETSKLLKEAGGGK